MLDGSFQQSRLGCNFIGGDSVRKYRELRTARSGTNQTPADCIPDEAGGLMDIQLFHNAGPVGFGCLWADVQKLRALFGRLAFGDQLKDLSLPGREWILHNI